MKYHTKSGSIYEVDAEKKQIRKLATGYGSNTKRVGDDWRPYERLEFPQLATEVHLVVHWGSGRDAVSDELGTPLELPVERYTMTSPIERQEP